MAAFVMTETITGPLFELDGFTSINYTKEIQMDDGGMLMTKEVFKTKRESIILIQIHPGIHNKRKQQINGNDACRSRSQLTFIHLT